MNVAIKSHIKNVFPSAHTVLLHSVLCLVAQLCLTLCDSMDSGPPGSSDHGDSPGKNTGVACHALLQGNFPNLGTEQRSPSLQVDSLPLEPPRKHMLHYTVVC